MEERNKIFSISKEDRKLYTFTLKFISVLEEVCRMVALLHKCHGLNYGIKGSNFIQIVHRDLKLNNLLWSGSTIKIADFGLARVIGDSKACDVLLPSRIERSVEREKSCSSDMTAICGRFGYAPEMWSGYYDESVDVYAMGIMLIQTLYPISSSEGETYRSFIAKIKEEGKISAEIPGLECYMMHTSITKFILRMIGDDPLKRPKIHRVAEVLEGVHESVLHDDYWSYRRIVVDDVSESESKFRIQKGSCRFYVDVIETSPESKKL